MKDGIKIGNAITITPNGAVCLNLKPGYCATVDAACITAAAAALRALPLTKGGYHAGDKRRAQIIDRLTAAGIATVQH
jgi:hypothetical protein